MSAASNDAAYAAYVLLQNRFMAPAYRSALAAAALLPGSHGLDAGCGPGGLLALLDDATGRRGRIVAIDRSAAAVDQARRRIEQHGLAPRVTAQQVDLRDTMPFDDASFDWIWSADVLFGDLFPDPPALLREWVRVLKPGGRIVLLFGNFYRAMLIPGYGHIERALQEASSRQFRRPSDEQTPLRAASYEQARGWLLDAGLERVGSSTHLAAYHAPLDAGVAAFLGAALGGPYGYGGVTREEALAAGLRAADWELWCALRDPASPRFILERRDYQCVRYATLSSGLKPR